MCFSVEQFYKDTGEVSAIIRIHFSIQDYLGFYRKKNYAQRGNNFFCQTRSMDAYADLFTSRKKASEFHARALAT